MESALASIDWHSVTDDQGNKTNLLKVPVMDRPGEQEKVAQDKRYPARVANAANGVSSSTPNAVLSATAVEVAETAAQLDNVSTALQVEIRSSVRNADRISFSTTTPYCAAPMGSKTWVTHQATTRNSSHHSLPTRHSESTRRPTMVSTTNLRISPSPVQVQGHRLATTRWFVWTLTTRRLRSFHPSVLRS